MTELQKVFRVDVHHDDPTGDDMPVQALYSIDQAAAQEIVELAALVQERGLLQVTKADRRVHFYSEWPEDDEKPGMSWDLLSRAQDTTLVVTRTAYWFEATVEEVSVQTDEGSVVALAEQFEIGAAQGLDSLPAP